MKFCFCRFILAVAILVLTLVWWPATWAKIVIIIASILLAIMSLFYNVCCLHRKKEGSEAVVEEPAPERPMTEE